MRRSSPPCSPLRPLAGLATLAVAGALLAPWVASAQRAPLVLVALGDSTGAGVGAGGAGYPALLARRLEAQGVPVKLVNLSVPGATADALVRDQLARALAASPALVTVGIGTNDVGRNRPLREFARDLHDLGDRLKRLKVPVVFTTIPDLTRAPALASAPASYGRRIEAFNAVITQTAQRHGLLVADVLPASRRALRDDPASLFAEDGFHPNAKGYEVWADAMWPVVERAMAPRVQARRPGAAATGSSR
jgi:lysophospholipase L1-like esterase